MNASQILRLLMGISCLAIGIVFGYLARSPWVLLPLAAAFSVAFAIGKWRAWRDTYKASYENKSLMAKALAGQVATFISQLILCGILYLIGSGIGSLIVNDRNFASHIESNDWLAILSFLIANILMGIMLIKLESRNTNASEPSDIEFKIEDTPVTIDNFFSSHHYSHYKIIDKDSGQKVLNKEKAFISEDTILEVEKRHGIHLPDTLRKLYLKQNGGSGIEFYTPCPSDYNASSKSGWIGVFGGYNDLPPIENLKTLGEIIDNYTSRDEEPEKYPSNPEKIIVLSNWYSEFLFLDCRKNPDNPKVGFIDFGRTGENLSSDEWESEALWWNDFDNFMKTLRFGEYK